MKRISLFLFLVILVSILTSCGEFVSPVAYTRFDTDSGYYVYYGSVEVSNQIKVYDSDSSNAKKLMEFNFTRCLGANDLGGKRYTLVYVKYKPGLSVFVDKSIASSNNFYLNDSILIPDSVNTLDDGSKLFFFNEIGSFIRTNPNGSIDPEKVNVLEYK